MSSAHFLVPEHLHNPFKELVQKQLYEVMVLCSELRSLPALPNFYDTVSMQTTHPQGTTENKDERAA